MKTAKEWQEELREETSIESIKRIQEDALNHAITEIYAKSLITAVQNLEILVNELR